MIHFIGFDIFYLDDLRMGISSNGLYFKDKYSRDGNFFKVS